MYRRSTIRQERGEHYLDFVRRKTSLRSLVDPRTFVYDLGLISDGTSHTTICEVLKGQYRLAKDLGDSRWIETTRRETATILCSDRWVDDNLPSLLGNHRSRRTKTSHTAEATSSMCVDIRLKTNPNLEVVRTNAADSNARSMEISDSSEVHGEADSSADHDTADQECGISAPTGLMVNVREPEPTFPEPIPVIHNPGKRMHPARHVEAKQSTQDVGSKRARMDHNLSITVLTKPSSHLAQLCPFPNCVKREKKIKRHVQRQHLPRIFSDIKPIRSIDESVLCQLQYSSLISLVISALGQNADVYSAVNYVNQSGGIPKNTSVHPDTIACMRKFSVPQGWAEPPEGFTVSPVNSPAALFHWRCLVVLLSLLPPIQREEFRVDGRVRSDIKHPTNTEDSQVPVVDSSTEDEFTVIDVSYGSDVEVCNEKIITVNEAFDSHFHLDRTSFRIWKKSSGKSVDDLISYSFSGNQHPQLDVSVAGGVIVYSEPSTHPEIVSVERPWGVAVGVHPKHTEEFSRDRFLHMKELLNRPHVVALGEVGLDRTVPVKLWRRQEDVLCQVLTLSRKDKVLVLHLRGTPADRIGMDVHARCMQILHTSCDPDQPIHLHCFTGDARLVKEWMNSFSHVYFGFTGAVETFSTDQIDGLRAVPMNRMLLETDSPYMKPGGGYINTPAFIGDVATVVASKLQISVRYLLNETVKNCRKLYAL